MKPHSASSCWLPCLSEAQLQLVEKLMLWSEPLQGAWFLFQ